MIIYHIFFMIIYHKKADFIWPDVFENGLHHSNDILDKDDNIILYNYDIPVRFTTGIPWVNQ